MDEVAVRIVGGGPHDWIMVPAQLVEFNMYVLLDFPQPDDVDLEFRPGNLVTTIPLPDKNGQDGLVAHRLYIA